MNACSAFLEVVTDALGSVAVLTAAVVIALTGRHMAAMLDGLQACLVEHFDVEHSTFQFERQVHTDHEHATHA
jgi:cobalt-zinc-cadmium efflux system protein